mmetsp:Transcript_18382/g.37225  ORF Transcript_18382/g.37225 Transcript_18382/m.37225 type:complete len:351 (-) Transcript_18382:1064-2116(-)
MSSCLLNLSRGLLQIEEGTSARRARNEFSLGVTHTASLEEGESSVAEEIDAEVCLSHLLDQNTVSISVREQRTDFSSEFQGEFVGFGGSSFIVVDGRGHDVVGLQDFEDAAGGMQLGEVLVDADGDHHGVEVLDLGNRFIIFGAVNFDGETNGTIGELSILGDSFGKTHERNSIFQWILLELLSRDDNSSSNLHHSAKRRSGFGIISCGKSTHEDGIRGSNVFKGHSDRSFESEFFVEVRSISLRQHWRRNRADDRTIGVQKETDIDLLLFLLLRKSSHSASIGGNITSIDVLSHGFLAGISFGVGCSKSTFRHFRETVAWFILKLGILRQRNAHGISESICQKSSNTHS